MLQTAGFHKAQFLFFYLNNAFLGK